MKPSGLHDLAADDKPYYDETVLDELPYQPHKKQYTGLDIFPENRTIFQHDRDSILYSRSFRRLMHKTQVTYPGSEKDEHTRTRLTHTLEVVEISRTLTRLLKLNEDLTEAIALGHDIGHAPFGHEGEAFLNKALHGDETERSGDVSILGRFGLDKMNIDFKHNYQSVRVLLFREGEWYDEHNDKWCRGLNISYKTLEGILKHSRIRKEKDQSLYKYPEITSNTPISECLNYDYSILSIEGQIVALSDEIAQVCHDLEDAVDAEYTVKKAIYTRITKFLNDPKNSDIYTSIQDEPFIKKTTCTKNEMGLPNIKIKKDKTHQFISWVIGYLIGISKQDIQEKMDKYVAHKRETGSNLFPLDEELAGEEITIINNKLYQNLKDLQKTYIINNIRINRENSKSDHILKKILLAYMNKPKQLPDSVLTRYSEICTINEIRHELDRQQSELDETPNIRYVLQGNWSPEITNKIRKDPDFIRILWDYVATMTDQYAINEYKMLYLDEPAHRYSI